MHKIQK